MSTLGSILLIQIFNYKNVKQRRPNSKSMEAEPIEITKYELNILNETCCIALNLTQSRHKTIELNEMNTAATTAFNERERAKFLLNFSARFFFQFKDCWAARLVRLVITIAIENLYRGKMDHNGNECVCQLSVSHQTLAALCAADLLIQLRFYISFYDHVMIIASSSWHRVCDHSFSVVTSSSTIQFNSGYVWYEAVASRDFSSILIHRFFFSNARIIF